MTEPQAESFDPFEHLDPADEVEHVEGCGLEGEDEETIAESAEIAAEARELDDDE